MKKYLKLEKIISILAMIIAIISISSCSKEIKKTNNGSGSTGKNNVTSGTGSAVFWIDSDLGCGNIQVTINGTTNYIITYYNSSPSCGEYGCANFTLPVGSYNYTASCDSYTWNGTINITSNGCNKMQLTGNGSGSTNNMDLNGKWISDGTGIQISGSSATFYCFGGNWQTANSKGFVNTNSLKLKNIYINTATNSWNCQDLYMTTTNNIIDGTTWSNDGEIIMSPDGNSIMIQSTGPISGNFRSVIYTRVN